jgi:hypothetical protein
LKIGYATLAIMCVAITYFVGTTVFSYESSTLGTAVIAEKSKYKGGQKVINLSAERMTARQMQVLNMAKTIAIEDGNNPEAFQAVIFQETKAGGMKQFRVAGQESGLQSMKRYYGITQIKLAAAWDVLARFPALHQYSESGKFTTEEELVANLILNDEFNLRVGSKYFKIVAAPDASLARRVTAYNRGLQGSYRVDPASWHYTVAVEKHMATVVKQVNRILARDNKVAALN